MGLTRLAPLALALALGATDVAGACSCVWRGPFLTVAPSAPLIVRATVLGHHGKRGTEPLAMDLQVLETLRGESPGSPLRVWGDDGMLCRPYVSRFPVGTEWVLGLDGPGSKSGMSPGHAISVCGRYWLEVRGDTLLGNLDRPDSMDAVQSMSLDRFRARLATVLREAGESERRQASFTGEAEAGETFEQPFGPDLRFRLEPSDAGWTVTIRQGGRDEDLSRLTPPLHGPPNPRDIEGRHFRNADNTGPNEPGEKNVNAPGDLREFIFSPEVGRTIDGPGASRSVEPRDIEAVRAFGRGTLRILDYRLSRLGPGQQAAMAWMRFEVELSWAKTSHTAR
jgi:hypothetical protein